jgi:hypothetical protein
MAEKKTMKEMCDVIVEADFLRKEDGTKPTAEEIFNYSPSGELSQVFFLYYEALAILKRYDEMPKWVRAMIQPKEA